MHSQGILNQKFEFKMPLHSCGIIVTKYRCIRKSIAQNQRYHSGTVCIYLRKFLCQKTTYELKIYNFIYYTVSLEKYLTRLYLRKHQKDALCQAPDNLTVF